MLNIAISGANGFVGQKLSSTLLTKANINLIKIGRNNKEGYKNFINIETTSPEDMGKQLVDFDCFIHLAARAHTKNATREDFQRDNINLSKDLACIAYKAKIKQFIYLSSIKVLGNTTPPGKPFKAQDIPTPCDSYGKSKLEGEILIKEILHDTDTSLTIIRSPLIWGDKCKGNLNALIKLINKGVPIPVGAINNCRDIISINNLCSFICHIILHPEAKNRIFLVSDGIKRSTKEIVGLLEIFSEKTAILISVPNIIFVILKLIPFVKPQIESVFDNLEIDISETKNLLNWIPIE